MAKFLGRFEHTLDDKGRVAIPARFRRALPPEANDTFIGVLRNEGSEKYLALYSSDEIHEKLADIASKSGRLEHIRDLKRAYYGSVSDFPIDPQGRISIAPEVRNRLDLTKDVLFIGMEDVVELWDPGCFEARMKERGGLSQLEYRVFGPEQADGGE